MYLLVPVHRATVLSQSHHARESFMIMYRFKSPARCVLPVIALRINLIKPPFLQLCTYVYCGCRVLVRLMIVIYR